MLRCFKVSGVSFAMGNASDEIKRQATHVTASNEEEGFAKAIEMILRDNQRLIRVNLDVVPGLAGTHTPGSIVEAW